MGEIVSLRRARKAKARAASDAKAAENRFRHGTPKAASRLARRKEEQVARNLESHRLAPRGDSEKAE